MRWRQVGRRRKAKSISRHFVNIHPDPSYVTKENSNAELQKEQPNWYGPYLEPGERYKTERSPENVAKACA